MRSRVPPTLNQANRNTRRVHSICRSDTISLLAVCVPQPGNQQRHRLHRHRLRLGSVPAPFSVAMRLSPAAVQLRAGEPSVLRCSCGGVA